MSKIIVTFEAPEDMREFIRQRAKMQEKSISGYLRSLVKDDQVMWQVENKRAWARWQQPVDNFGVRHEG